MRRIYNIQEDLLYKLLINGEATAEEQSHAAGWIIRLHTALALVLTDIDYTNGAGSPSESIGGLLNPITLAIAQKEAYFD